MAKDAITVLREARELVSDPKRWTQRAFAKDASGNRVGSSDRDAVCWCALGAHNRASAGNSSGYWSFLFLQEAAESIFKNNDPSEVNDELGHEAVLRMFDAAIASAEKEAQV